MDMPFPLNVEWLFRWNHIDVLNNDDNKTGALTNNGSISSSRCNCMILLLYGLVSGMRRLSVSGAKWAAGGGRSPLRARRELLQCDRERRAVRTLVLHHAFSTRQRAQGRAVSTRYSVAKVCAMIYKWEPPSNVRVTLIAHGEPVYWTKDIRNSPAVRDGGRATPSGRTRGSNISTYLLWESNGNQFLMCQVSIAYCCYVRSLNASSRNYKVMQMSSERFYTRGNQKTIHNFNKL